MRIDLETHYSVHPLPSPPLLSKNETYFEACCFVSPPPPPPRRKEEALDEKQISIFAAIIAPLLPPPAAREMPALSLVLEFERGEEDTVVDSRRRSASEMNFIAQLGSFIGKISCASARKPPKVDIWGRDSCYSTGHYSLSFFFFLSCSLVDLASIRASERSIDLITVNLSLSILGDQILVRFFQPMNDCTIQEFLNVCVRLLLLLLLFLFLFFFFWFKILRFLFIFQENTKF